ncbi:MAG: hypothetical protein SFX73_37240 [Kofleriaceae bacterium]|nr:hypothetical protein [Kofleriaceae bacterium]
MLIRPVMTLVLLASCQGGSSSKQEEPQRTAAPAVPTAIEVHDTKGSVTAKISADRPCRANVDGIELIVGTRPVVATVGAVQWTGDDDNGGTLIRRDGEPVARLAPGQDTLGLFDPNGVAIVRAMLSNNSVRVVSGQGALLRTATRTSTGIAVGDQTVTGTDDLLLAAVLAAPEARPEVRALAACLRANPGDRAL